MELVIPAAEVASFFLLLLSIFLKSARSCLIIPFMFTVWLFVLAIALGYPKSSYHMLLVVVVLYSACMRERSEGEIKGGRITLYVILVSWGVAELLTLDLSFAGKNSVPMLFPFWCIILVSTQREIFFAFAVLIIIVDIIISTLVSARGVFLGSVAALLMLWQPIKLSSRTYMAILSSIFLIYVFALPLFTAFGWLDSINSSASNNQRALMNVSAVIDTASNIITLSENSIFESAAAHRYAHDAEVLTVHNLFLAFGLFNGFIPALLLLFSVIYIVVKQLNSRYAAPLAFLYLYILLGPDGSETRISLMAICVMSMFCHGNEVSKSFQKNGLPLGVNSACSGKPNCF